jgi:hypothetical protein
MAVMRIRYSVASASPAGSQRTSAVTKELTTVPSDATSSTSTDMPGGIVHSMLAVVVVTASDARTVGASGAWATGKAIVSATVGSGGSVGVASTCFNGSATAAATCSSGAAVMFGAAVSAAAVPGASATLSTTSARAEDSLCLSACSCVARPEHADPDTQARAPTTAMGRKENLSFFAPACLFRSTKSDDNRTLRGGLDNVKRSPGPKRQRRSCSQPELYGRIRKRRPSMYASAWSSWWGLSASPAPRGTTQPELVRSARSHT